jgi:A/G-specific adenine glycosylase
MKAGELEQLQQHLFSWYHQAVRDFPWKDTQDPYHIFVSEMMLQQTQAERVAPRYTAFLETFPTLESLANAPPAEVIRLWAGLGYNRRAVHMQQSAAIVCEQYGGAFPQDVAELQRLPGIGAYTAGAIACFAFGQDVVFLDTNIRRVLRRCFRGEPPDPPTDREILALSREYLPTGQGRLWNLSVMELGAQQCTAKNPTCQQCPIRAYCVAFADRRATPLPSPPPAAIRPRRIAEQREPFVGSNRYYRGRLVAALCDAAPGEAISLSQLGSHLKPDYHADDLPWLQNLVAGLVQDRLIEFDAARGVVSLFWGTGEREKGRGDRAQERWSLENEK